MQTAAERYDSSMRLVRERTDAHPAIVALLDPKIRAEVLLCFLMEYCSLGVQMTAPVEGWIRRAGLRCREIGLATVGDRLVKHAAHEAGHDRLFVDDTRSLVAVYAHRYKKQLEPATLLERPCTKAMSRYIDLHEQTILGPVPFAQVAIELEIEGLSVTLGPKLIEQFRCVLGPEILGCLSFLQEHVALDVGHTILNRKMLGHLLEIRPDAVDSLVDSGSQALTTYLDFLSECLASAEQRGSASAN